MIARAGSCGSTIGTVLVVVAWTAATPGAPAAAGEPALLYTATREGSTDLYLRADGGERRLTTPPGTDNWGTWSPDGQWIAFQSQRDGNYEVYRMRHDGTAAENLSRHPAHDGLAVWSPDGARLAFFSSRGFDYPERSPIPGHVYVMAASGGEARRVTIEPLSSTLGPSSWSPDGAHLLLARVIDGNSDLVELDVATGGERVVVATPAGEGGGLYSPDGQRIAYYAEGADGAALMLVPAAGGTPRALRAGGGSWYPFDWSPDGRWISVTWIGADGTWELRAVEVDGPGERVLAAGDDRPREGSWRPGAGEP